jgi:hypothetical protein
MSPKEVEDLLGAPKESSEVDMSAALKGANTGMPGMPGMPNVDLGGAFGKITVKYWEEGDKGYSVLFQNDKVTQTSSGTKDEMKAKMKKG